MVSKINAVYNLDMWACGHVIATTVTEGSVGAVVLPLFPGVGCILGV